MKTVMKTVEPADRQVFASSTGRDHVTLGLQRLDALVGVERDGALRPAVEAQIALPVAGDSVFRDLGAWDAVLGYAALRIHVDLDDVADLWGHATSS